MICRIFREKPGLRNGMMGLAPELLQHALWTQAPPLTQPHLQHFPQLPTYLNPYAQQQAMHHMPFHHPQMIPQPAPVFPPFQPGLAGAGIQLAGSEVSPTNSGHSSPSQSPHLHHVSHKRIQQVYLQPTGTDSSSDDSERGIVFKSLMHTLAHIISRKT